MESYFKLDRESHWARSSNALSRDIQQPWPITCKNCCLCILLWMPFECRWSTRKCWDEIRWFVFAVRVPSNRIADRTLDYIATVCVCVATCSPVLRVFANDRVSMHRPVLSPHLEAALNRIKFLVTRSPTGVTTNVSNSPLCHQIQQQAPQSVPPKLRPSPLVAPTRNGRCWIFTSSLPPHRLWRWAYWWWN